MKADLFVPQRARMVNCCGLVSEKNVPGNVKLSTSSLQTTLYIVYNS